jgi:DNA-binding transcriptional LysR family regulator
VLLEDGLVCVVCRGHPLAKGRMTPDRYFKFPHVIITLMSAERDLTDESLAALGKQRRIGLRVPYLAAAVMAVKDTPLIATMPRRVAELYAVRAEVAIIPAPFKVDPVPYVMAWHPRVDAEPAHVWLRKLIADTARDL